MVGEVLFLFFFPFAKDNRPKCDFAEVSLRIYCQCEIYITCQLHCKLKKNKYIEGAVRIIKRALHHDLLINTNYKFITK